MSSYVACKAVGGVEYARGTQLMAFNARVVSYFIIVAFFALADIIDRGCEYVCVINALHAISLVDFALRAKPKALIAHECGGIIKVCIYALAFIQFCVSDPI
jgi:hypothetical protein